MGTDFEPTNLNGGFNTNNSLNTDLAEIKTALSRMLNLWGDSTTGDNVLRIDLDMGSNQVLNLPEPVDPTDPVTLQYGDANYGGAAVILAEAARDAAILAQLAAEAAQAAAALSEANAATSESNASTSETNAAASALAAASSETNAASSAASASTSASNAATSELNASTSEANAGASAGNAAASEASAASAAAAAAGFAGDAAASAGNAAVSELNAATSETNAATSASNAATSASNAAQSETDASEWAQYTAGSVPGEGVNDYSAKAWAQNVLTGATLGGSSKDWAQTAEDVLVDGTGYSAFHWAQKAATASGGDTVKVSANDTTADYLFNKIVGGGSLEVEEVGDGGNEDVRVTDKVIRAWKKTQTDRNTTTTLTDDPALVLSGLEIDTEYEIEGIIYLVIDITAGFKWKIANDNIGGFLMYGGVSYFLMAANDTQHSYVDNDDLNATFNTVGTYGSSTEIAVQVKGTIRTRETGASQLSFQWAQQVSSANTISVKKGSYLVARKIGDA